MKEYGYEVEQSWEQQRRATAADVEQSQVRSRRQRTVTGDDAGGDADASSMSGMYMRLL
jgi:hypothetical protein